jgi:DNA-binding response OmpR family regulator
LSKYLVKPVTPQDFKETIKLLALRLDSANHSRTQIKEEYTWDSTNKQLFRNNEPIPLKQKEQALLNLLVSKRGECITFPEIMAHVWEDEFEKDISVQSVKLQVTMLRKKLPKDSIQNVYGKGYMLT